MEHQSAVTYGNRLRKRLSGARLDRRRHQPEVRLHHHSRKRARMVRQQRHRAADVLRHVDSRRVDHLPAKSSTSKHMCGKRRWAQVHQRLQVEGAESRARSSRRAASTRRRRRTSTSRARSSSTRCEASSTTTRSGSKLIHDFYQHFKYQNIMTEDVVAFFNQQTGLNLTPIFDQYLRHADLPVLELTFDEARRRVSYRWKADEPGFACRSASAAAATGKSCNRLHGVEGGFRRRLKKRRFRSRDRPLLRERVETVGASTALTRGPASGPMPRG